MYLYLFVSTFVLAFVWVCESLRRKNAFAKNLPMAKPTKSFLGVDYSIMDMSDEERFEVMNDCFARFDRLFVFYTGPLLVLAVSHPNLVQKLLSHPDCLEKPYFYDFVKFEQGIFSAKYKLWKGQRKALNPTFNLRILHSFFPIFDECSKKLVQELKKLPKGETVNLFRYTSHCALEMVCGTTLGSDVLEREGKDEFLSALEEIFGLVSRRMLSVHLYSDLIYMMTPAYWKEQFARNKLRSFAMKILQEKKETARDGKTNGTDLDSEPETEEFKKPQIFIDQLLSISDISRSFTDEEILCNVLVIMIAGNDTSGLAVAYGCLFLAMFPHIQERVYAEIMEHFSSDEMEITADSLRPLEYTERFLKETLRHCPVAANIARENMKDIELDGVTIPAGTKFTVSFWALHRRADMWGPEVHSFDPDHFLPERCRDRNPNAYMPFSTGARNCIGGRYAMLSTKVMLIHILKNFKITTKLRFEDMRYKFGMTLKMSTDHLVQLERRF